MSRYTINIGDDFPMGEDDGNRPGRPPGRRFRMVLRILFFVAVVAIVVGHPFKVALVTGLVLLLHRSGWWQRVRSDIRARGLFRRDHWRAEAQRWASRYGQCWGNRCRDRRPEQRGFKEFV